MYKMVLKDYRLHFKDSLKNLYNSGWYVYIYMAGMLPIITDSSDSIRDLLNYYFTFIPFIIALMLSRMYCGLMGKNFYLCPLSKEQRKSYFIAGMKLRITFPIVLFIILDGILMIIKFESLFLFFAKLFVISCAAVSFNIYCQPIVKSDNITQRRYPLLGNYELHSVLAQCFSIFNLLVFSNWDNLDVFSIIVAVIGISLQLYICIQLIRKFYPQIICQTEYFE